MSKKPRHLRVVGGQPQLNSIRFTVEPQYDGLKFADLPKIAEETDCMHAMILEFRMVQSRMPMYEASANVLEQVKHRFEEGVRIVDAYENLLESWLSEPQMKSKRTEIEAVQLKLNEARALLIGSLATLELDLNASGSNRGVNANSAVNRRENSKTAEPSQKTVIKRAHVKNVVRVANNFSNEMWETLDELIESPTALSQLRFGIETMVESIEVVCMDQGTIVLGMHKPSLQSFIWMKFLLADDNLRAHIEALRVARYTALEHGLAVQIHLANTPKSLYKFSDKGDHFLVKAHEGFISATPDVWLHIMKMLKDGSPVSRAAVVGFGSSTKFHTTFDKLITMMCECRSGL